MIVLPGRCDTQGIGPAGKGPGHWYRKSGKSCAQPNGRGRIPL